MNSKFAVFAALVCTVFGLNDARAELLNYGSTYNNSGTDFATGGVSPLNQTITLSTSAQSFGGGSQITETTTALPGGAEYVEFFVSNPTGAPLVANGSSNTNEFEIFLNSIQLTGLAVSSNYYFDFTTNGAANTGITGYSGLGVEANPNPGSIGTGQNAFYFTHEGQRNYGWLDPERQHRSRYIGLEMNVGRDAHHHDQR